MNKYSGVLMHISSLPSDYGIGTLGFEAKKFVDFLANSGQTYWQILPLGPTSFGDSPYSSFSAFAGNPYFIDLDLLKGDGLLKDEDYKNISWGEDDCKVDYGTIYNHRFEVLHIAYRNFKENIDYLKFCFENKNWLDSYSLFMALKGNFDGHCWLEWPEDFRLKEKNTIHDFEKNNIDNINFYKFIQYEFFKQWKNLKNYANSEKVYIFGDCPIYVSLDSSDVWDNRDIFQLSREGTPKVVAGVPPDYFSEDGQLWGNPIYDWTELKNDHYSWWMNRLKHYEKIYDVLRIDHFIGFESYYAIPFGSTNGKIGERFKGPGLDFINMMKSEVKKMKIVAEDLGVVTDDVKVLLKQSGFPGMRVMRFGYNGDLNNDNLIKNFPVNCFGYCTSHDTDTCMEWFNTCSDEEKEYIQESCKFDKNEDPNWNLINCLLSSDSIVTIIQAQDLLALGNGGRMNTPGTSGDNWMWRTKKDSFDDKIAGKLRKYTEKHRRTID